MDKGSSPITKNKSDQPPTRLYVERKTWDFLTQHGLEPGCSFRVFMFPEDLVNYKAMENFVEIELTNKYGQSLPFDLEGDGI